MEMSTQKIIDLWFKSGIESEPDMLDIYIEQNSWSFAAMPKIAYAQSSWGNHEETARFLMDTCEISSYKLYQAVSNVFSSVMIACVDTLQSPGTKKVFFAWTGDRFVSQTLPPSCRVIFEEKYHADDNEELTLCFVETLA